MDLIRYLFCATDRLTTGFGVTKLKLTFVICIRLKKDNMSMTHNRCVSKGYETHYSLLVFLLES